MPLQESLNILVHPGIFSKQNSMLSVPHFYLLPFFSEGEDGLLSKLASHGQKRVEDVGLRKLSQTKANGRAWW